MPIDTSGNNDFQLTPIVFIAAIPMTAILSGMIIIQLRMRQTAELYQVTLKHFIAQVQVIHFLQQLKQTMYLVVGMDLLISLDQR